MTFYEFIVPVIALGIGGLVYLLVLWEERQLDRYEAKKDNPAE